MYIRGRGFPKRVCGLQNAFKRLEMRLSVCLCPLISLCLYLYVRLLLWVCVCLSLCPQVGGIKP